MRSWKFRRGISIRIHASPNSLRSRVLLKPIKKRSSWRCGVVSERRPRHSFCRREPPRIGSRSCKKRCARCLKIRSSAQKFKKLVTDEVSPLMPEELMKVIKETPRDAEVIEMLKKFSGVEPLPPRCDKVEKRLPKVLV